MNGTVNGKEVWMNARSTCPVRSMNARAGVADRHEWSGLELRYSCEVNQIRALLLTDVVDSTKLAEQLGDAAMASLWAAHDRLARDLLVPHDGLEIDKTDGFLMLFDDAAHAIAHAVAYHRALRTLDPPLMARAGLHVGEVILTANSRADVARGAKPIEVDGLAKPTAARVMSLAGSGQTLVTADAVAALGPTDLRVESHGHWRLKGVSEPIELFEVGDETAPFTPPADGAKVYRVVADGDSWLPAEQVKHSLPAERDAFVGRQADLLALARRLDANARLVSILGIGGTGKTRLVIRYGWSWLGDYPGGVWFCDLSEARDVDGILHAVARALDVPLGQGDPISQLGHAIAGRGPCLLLLDNFEQVVRHAGETLGLWLDRAPEAQFVITTREVLGLPGEEALALAPLPASDGVALFVARARSAKRDFEPDDVASIDALVKLLDGLPLAIELAGARVRVMPPAKLLERMSQRFKLLTSSGGRRDRQATLRATLDWSWELLSADEQAALAQLSVFEGGFSLEAAEAVLTLDESWPMDVVQALGDKSLVRQVSDERFDLLVSVQEYASERLDAAGGRSDAEQRHGAHFATHGTDEALDALSACGGVALRWALAQELDNLVAASRRALARGDGEAATGTALAAWAWLEMSGPLAVAVGVLDGARRGAKDVTGRARVTAGLASALTAAGRIDEAPTHFQAALAGFREIGNRRGEGQVLANLGVMHVQQGRMDEARAQLDAALAVHREVGNRRGEGFALANLGILHMLQGRMDEARTHHDAALAAAREVGDRSGEGNALGYLGLLHSQQGRMDEARTLFDAALAVHREVGSRASEGNMLCNLGILHNQQGRKDEARAHYEAAVAVFRQVGSRKGEGIVLGNLSLVDKAQGRTDEARAHGEAALAMAREVENRRSEAYALSGLGDLHLEQGRMDEARAHDEAALALARELGIRQLEGAMLSALGRLHLEQGRLEEARACVDEGERTLREVGELNLLGQVLCVRARIERTQGDLEAARASLAEGEALAATLGASAESALGGVLAEERIALETP
jgi:predicted ATPase/class 3 adenylate cyclase